MKYYRSEIVKQAQSWIGKKESNGSHKEIIDIYNSHTPRARGYKMTYTAAWCATFVSAVAIKCGYTAIIPTEVSCDKMIELFKKKGCWVEADNYVPSSGDCIFYDWEDNDKGDNTGNSNHVGIVEKVVGTTITVIEGNYSNAVKRRTIKVNAQYIRGYGVPKYDGNEKQETTTEVTNLKYEKGNKVTLNGYLYKDSYGNGKGKKKINYKGTITIVNKNGSKPYHVDNLGWVAEEDLSLTNSTTLSKGDKVKITGSYASSASSLLAAHTKAKGKTVYITKIYSGKRFPYQLGKVKGSTASVDTIGFAKASSIVKL